MTDNQYWKVPKDTFTLSEILSNLGYSDSKAAVFECVHDPTIRILTSNKLGITVGKLFTIPSPNKIGIEYDEVNNLYHLEEVLRLRDWVANNQGNITLEEDKTKLENKVKTLVGEIPITKGLVHSMGL